MKEIVSPHPHANAVKARKAFCSRLPVCLRRSHSNAIINKMIRLIPEKNIIPIQSSPTFFFIGLVALPERAIFTDTLVSSAISL